MARRSPYEGRSYELARGLERVARECRAGDARLLRAAARVIRRQHRAITDGVHGWITSVINGGPKGEQ